MKLKVQSIHFDADRKLLSFVEEKIEKLTHFYEDIIDGEVFLRLDKNSEKENKIAEIKLKVPGKELLG
jgi:putative sigma-54 modulation protein